MTIGAVYRQPEANPSGNSPADSIRCPGSSEIHPGGVAGVIATSMPLTCRIAAAGTAACSDSTARPTRAHSIARADAPVRTGPQIAPAANDVVCSGPAAART